MPTCVLSALWRSWEALRLEPGTGVSVCYPHMNSLMRSDGTFSKCTLDGHNESGQGLDPLPTMTRVPLAVRGPRSCLCAVSEVWF
ncbi:DUF4913 domain-containing protein [Kribbella sp. NPDC003505]|uniref:DUF4913 domain-containing protein n=1 Tax=Kribbella sp. NPDC003505 TaxID=3154448 RepID=UPI0033A1AA26